MILLNEKELKRCISSVVRKLITEEMHVINSSLFKLAFFIYQEIDKEIRSGNNSIEFVITKEEISKYYPYRNPQPLKIICGLGVSKGKMEYKNGTILINVEIFYVGGEKRCISRIVHELTHFVNDNEGGIPVLYRTENKIYEKLSYYLRDTECNARCSEFGSFLKNEEQIKPLKEYEDITCLKRIKTFLDEGERIPVNGIKSFQRKFGEYRRRIFKIYSGFQVQ